MHGPMYIKLKIQFGPHTSQMVKFHNVFKCKPGREISWKIYRSVIQLNASEKNVELGQDHFFQIVPTSLVINNYAILHTAPATDVINKRRAYIYVAEMLIAISSFI